MGLSKCVLAVRQAVHQLRFAGGEARGVGDKTLLCDWRQEQRRTLKSQFRDHLNSLALRCTTHMLLSVRLIEVPREEVRIVAVSGRTNNEEWQDSYSWVWQARWNCPRHGRLTPRPEKNIAVSDRVSGVRGINSCDARQIHMTARLDVRHLQGEVATMPTTKASSEG